MALSGSFYNNVGSHWRLQIEWSATQSVANNNSTVTAKMYWIGLDQYSAVYSSASKTSGIKYNSNGWSTESGSLAQLSAYQKKLINTYSFTIGHDPDDGTASFSLDGYFDAEVTLAGTYYGTISMTAKSFTLNTIPRKSTYTGATSWTAGSNFTLSASRKSSSFTHTANIDMQDSGGTWRNIKSVDFSTSASTSFSLAENTNIFTWLNGRSSASARINFHTNSGGSSIGYDTITMSLSAPNVNTTSWGGNFNIGDTMNGSINKGLNSSYVTSTVQLIFGGSTYTLKTKISETDWSYDTNAIASSLYGKIPNDKSITGQIRIYSYYNNVQIRTYAQSNVTATVVNSEPTFSGSTVYYEDSSTAKNTTGDATKIVQNVSTIKVLLPATSKATSKNGSTMVNYIATLGGVQQTASYSTSDIYFDFPSINASVDQVLTITAVDSRGFTTEINRTVTMIAYQPPTLNGTAKRKNGFDDETTFLVKGDFSPVNTGTGNKNSITSVKYRYKKTTDATTVSTWSVWSSFTVTPTGTTYVTNSVPKTLINTASWNVEFQVVDKFGSRTVALTVSTGKPIFFLDSTKKSVGVGMFPTLNNSLEIGGLTGIISATEPTLILSNTAINNALSGSIEFLESPDRFGTVNGYGYKIGHNGSTNEFKIQVGVSATVLDLMTFDRNADTTVHGNLRVKGNMYLASNNAIYSDFNGSYIIRDHGNGNVTLSASGNALYLGYQNTEKVLVSSDVYAYNGSDRIFSKYGDYFTTYNLNNRSATNTLGWSGDIARIRYGGSGAGADNGFQIVGPGESIKADFTNSGHIYAGAGYFRGQNNVTLQSDTGYVVVRSNGSSSDLYLQTNTVARVVAPNTTSTFKPIYASAFSVQSVESAKENITEYDSDALFIVNQANIYEYDLKAEGDNPDRKRKIGFIIGRETPDEVLDYKKESVDLYGMSALMWKSIQELSARVDYLNERLKNR